MPDSQRPSPKVRLLVASWPDDAARGAIAAFCEEHGVLRSWFRKIRATAQKDGMVRAVEPRSTRPATSPNRTTDDMVGLALKIRAELKDDGWDHGPLSVLARLERTGLPNLPSRATLARIFLATGVVQPEPKKKPRSALRRFVYPAPNCLWQIDATEWTLADGSPCVIFQLIDDHSRKAVGSLVARGETSEAAVAVVAAAIARHGAPQKFLSDNGLAFNPSRRGYTGQLVDYLVSLGVEPITGKPYKPTTQGKNERFHRTLHRWLNARPPASTMTELQELVNVFDIAYNTLRAHQSLEGRITPQAWDATEAAPSPTPLPTAIQVIAAQNTLAARPAGEKTIQVRPSGKIYLLSFQFFIGTAYTNQPIHAIWNEAGIEFYDHQGTLIIRHPWPPTGTRSIGNGRPRGGNMRTKSRDIEMRTKSRDITPGRAGTIAPSGHSCHAATRVLPVGVIHVTTVRRAALSQWCWVVSLALAESLRASWIKSLSTSLLLSLLAHSRRRPWLQSQFAIWMLRYNVGSSNARRHIIDPWKLRHAQS